MELIGVASLNVSEIGQYPTTEDLPPDIKLEIIARQGPLRAEDRVLNSGDISRPFQGDRDCQTLDSSSVLILQYIVAIVDIRSHEIWRCQMTPRENCIVVNEGSHRIEANVHPSRNTVIKSSLLGLAADECPLYAAKITFRLPVTPHVHYTVFDVSMTLYAKNCGQRLENNGGETICSSFHDRLHPDDVARPVAKIKIAGALSSAFGRTVIRHFQNLVDLGDYARIQRHREILANFVSRNCPSQWQDLVCFALLEEADACLTQRTMEEAEARAKEAFRLVQRYNSVNARVLRGYAFVVRAVAARVNKYFGEAEILLQRALEEMELVEACEFKCYAPYNVGTLAMDKLGIHGPGILREDERRKAQQAFRDAICYCGTQNESHMLPRVLNRQASFLLRTTPNKAPDTTLVVPEQDIREAREILTSLEGNVFPFFPTAEWAKTLYHINMSDLHMRCGDINQAIEEARTCRFLATQFGGLNQKKRAAGQRIQRLQDMLQVEQAPAV